MCYGMPDGREPIAVTVIDRITEVPGEDWDACAGPDNPSVSHAFLRALEESGSASPRRGWLPQHLVVKGSNGRLIGAVPLYLKSHSYGEYVFDWGWASAYERAGGSYYPKLQSCVPFTPVSGPRLLVAPEVEREAVANALIAAMAELARRQAVSSLHVTFPLRDEWERFGQAGFLQRTGVQYHWTNDGYRSFDDFLSRLSSRKRKGINKERRQVAESGVAIRVLTAGAIGRADWDAFYLFYLTTVDRKWANAYLTRKFFHLIGETMAERVVLILAEDRGEPVAAAFNLLGSDTLYGRNWGAARHYRFLHFEACYYRAVEFAIERGLKHVEAGAQGEHKIQRGYLPVETYSAHWIRDPSLRGAIADFLDRERALLGHEMAALMEHSPYRKAD